MTAGRGGRSGGAPRAARTGPPAVTYPAEGATAQDPSRWPAGYRRLRVRTRLGTGEAVFAAAAEALLDWRMHRAVGVGVDTAAPRAAPGVEVTVRLGVGPLRVNGPCRVVWAVAERRRAGWAYGTLPGHPQSGEEAFVVEHDPGDGTVWLDVRAFSRPGVWWTGFAGPLIPLFQRAYARRCGRVLRRLAVRGARGTGG